MSEKMRGCCPAEAATYRAENENPGVQPVTGTAREIGDRLGYEAGYVRRLAREGWVTRTGWHVDVVTPTSRTGKVYAGREYIAENPDEDPIIGPVSEIAALTGMTESAVNYLIRSGGQSRSGWTVREKPSRV